MKNILTCWVGSADLNACKNQEAVSGPIGQAVKSQAYDEVCLISNWGEEQIVPYKTWIERAGNIPVQVYPKKLSGPTAFSEIYESVVKVVTDILERHGSETKLTFHISPGTSQMAAVWIILSKTLFTNAELIESSIEQGVQTVVFPFEMSAEFIPDLLRPSDRRFELLSRGLPPECPEFSQIIYKSRIMQRVIAKAKHVAIRSVSVLIEGESGTGKELFARAIHGASTRKDKPFITVNCGAIPADLLESQLFGHVKGAFTGADKNQKGYFEEADGGTLFLDEIGELPLLSQVKLLRTLQESEVVRVGTAKPIKIDVRIIAATNRSLIDEIQEGRFRADLFYRLAVAILKIPPLRERSGDLSFLVDHFMAQVNKESRNDPGYKDKKISPDAKNLILQHSWPGNVRELLNTIQRAAIWSFDAIITREDIEEALIPLGTANPSDILNRPLGGEFKIEDVMEVVARHYIEKALKEANGKKGKAAELIGLSSYQTLGNWMKKYNIN
jgi:transcriptional regulator with PAS, ATPase and Fis domain